jgi:hypothetical protein
MQRNGTSMLFLCLLMLSFVAGSTLHASSVVVVAPNANAATSGTTVQLGVFGETFPTTFQTDIAASQLTSLIGNTITSIGYRIQADGVNIAGPVTITGFSLELSGSAHAIGSLSTNQAANIGANAQVVDSGTLVLSGLIGGPGPNPFFLINFATPYLYSGGDLLVTESYSTSSESLGVDAVHTGSLIDTSASIANIGGQVEFYNAPVTEFVATTPTNSPIPEPSSLALLGTGIASLAGLLRKRFA